MPNTIQLKRSGTAAAAPTTLEFGEIATNPVDKNLWVGDATKAPVLIASGIVRAFAQCTIAAGALTKVSGTVTVARIAAGVVEIDAGATDTVIINTDDQFDVGEVTAAAGKRRFNIRNADALGRPLADPTNLLITVFS